MCAEKDEAKTKLDRLIRAMDRLTDALQAAQNQRGQFANSYTLESSCG